MRWLILLLPILLQAEITALYLSWYDDPTTTMTIQWHTPDTEYGNTIYLQQNDEWQPIDGAHAALAPILVHKVSLNNLTPDTEYSFRIGADTAIYKFRTAPATLEHPIRFVVGGDIYSKPKIFRLMSKTVLEKKPLFAVLGGDLAYAIRSKSTPASSLRAWRAFLKDWKEHMIASDGHIIPFLLVSGNHDIAPDRYDTFFTLFAFPKKQLYRTVDFGSYLSLFLLDTGHFQPIEGRQTLWLEKTLSQTTAPYRFAVYHEAAYPSCYPYFSSTPQKIRNYWVPLFEKYNILAAFENHNHAFKRTHPIKAGSIDPTGITYLGDGSWGAKPRSTNDLWYLAQKSSKSNVLLVDLTPSNASIEALDLFNNLIDSISIPPNKQSY